MKICHFIPWIKSIILVGDNVKTSLGHKFDNTDIEFYIWNKICNQTDLDISCFAYLHLTEIEVSMCMERVNNMCSISYTLITFTSPGACVCSLFITITSFILLFLSVFHKWTYKHSIKFYKHHERIFLPLVNLFLQNKHLCFGLPVDLGILHPDTASHRSIGQWHVWRQPAP